jgi:hypothetical protein
MFDAIKPLVDSGIINEETKAAISEAWDSKLNEARDQIRAEMRNEFAGRYEHDKSVMVEALDKMVSESLQAEIREFADEKAQLSADRVRFNKRMAESAGKFDQFLVGKLAEEIKELREDRKQYQNSIKGLEKFVVKSLAEEIQEFAKDKQEVVETKVKLVREAKQKLASLQKQFVAQSANLVKESVAKNLESEMTQLKEDIQIARENNFGRRLFEAFASEFAITHLNENTEIAKLTKALEQKEQQILEANQAAAQKAARPSPRRPWPSRPGRSRRRFSTFPRAAPSARLCARGAVNSPRSWRPSPLRAQGHRPPPGFFHRLYEV